MLVRFLGLVLALALETGMHFGARLFSTNANVLHVIGIGAPFVAATQPINALAFVIDGINFGASDIAYSAFSMVTVTMLSILCLFPLSSRHGFVGIWIALTFYMSLRAILLALLSRLGIGTGTGTGPWKFLV